MTSSAREYRIPGYTHRLTPSLLLLLGRDLHLRLVEHEVGLHLLNGLVRDVEAELLRVSQVTSGQVDREQHTFSAMARLSQSCLQVPNRV